MDLAPSPFRPQADPNSGRSAKRSNSRTPRATHAFASSGAVRRSAEPAVIRNRHIGKLTAAAIVVAGAIVWTTGSSEPFTPGSSEQFQPAAQSIALAPAAPSFFFDDAVDALERMHLPNSADTPTTTASDNATALDPNLPDVTAERLAFATNFESLGAKVPKELDQAPQAIANDEAMPLFEDEPDKNAPKTAPPVELAVVPAAPVRDGIESTDDATLTNAMVDEAGINSMDGGVQLVVVSSGDTFSGILNRHGLQVDQMNKLLTNDLVKEYLSNIDVGQVLELTHDETGQLSSLTVKVGNDRRVNIDRSSSGFDVSTVELPIERVRVVTSGMIDQSLYLAAEQADLKQSTIMELANIFQWELDFAREIKTGDKFSLVYDKLFREGEYVGDGDILAAEFVRGGRSYKAIRFTTDEGVSGYFTPEGKSKRRAFLRHPVDVVRITSKFNPKRLHPVLHQIRAHRGVDYGSPHGSPIYATADGKVTYSGSKSAYGNTVILKHGQKFSTLYAHMSRISDKSQVGARVKQGDVIGYVGKTGRVTGTHLHYEFRVNGEQIDPLKVELPEAQPIDSKYLASLKTLADEMTGLMEKDLQDANERVATAYPGY